MKTTFSKLMRCFVGAAWLLIAAPFAANTVRAADVSVSDSLVNLATFGEQNYRFVDPVSGESVLVVVGMSAVSDDPDDAFTFLDGNTHIAIGNPANSGDGNWVDVGETVEFDASLVSASSGVSTNSIQFRVAKIGIRPNGGVSWNSTASSFVLDVSPGEALYSLDSSGVALGGDDYVGQLFPTGGRFQLSDAGSYAGQSIVFNVTFTNKLVTVSAGTQVGGTNSAVPSLSTINPAHVVLAANFGGQDLVQDGISFTGISTNINNPMTNTFGAYTTVLSAPNGNLQTANFGDNLFGSFIWADNQDAMSINVAGLDSTKTYSVYYLAGDDRALAFNMLLNLTAAQGSNSAATTGTMSWGGSSSNAQDYTYLPVTVSGATSLAATMTKNGSSSGVGISGLIVVDNTSAATNHAPTLTAVNTLTNGVEDTAYTISYNELYGASDAADVDSDAISFRIESVTTGTLKKNGVNVVAGSTLLSSGESIVWTPSANTNGSAIPAFTVRASDRSLVSASPVQVSIDVAAVNDPPQVANQIPSLSATYGTFFSYAVSTNTFIDIDSPVLTYSMNMYEDAPEPPGINFDSATLILSGTPTSSGAYGAAIRANDGQASSDAVFQMAIAKAGLTVAPNNFSRAVGQTNPVFTGTISGIKNADNITATYATTATAGSGAGTYLIVATLNDPNNRLTNYTVTSYTGTLTITNVPVVYIADPRTNSWITNSSGRYARIYKTKTDQANGVTSTTWSNVFNQAVPVYAGVQEMYSSSNWVYVRASGLGSHVMGPWYFDVNKTQLFMYPINQKVLFRIPRVPTVATNKTLTSLGTIGYFVDGVAMYDAEDSYFWNGTTETNQGTGYWYRDAYVNESPSFDPNNAHQEQTGMHHYHANPPALRFLLSDNVLFDSVAKTYSENTTNANPKHSPIVGWLRDGYPVYGPYGYSNPTNANSPVRRMVSGFVLRNGQKGTDNLTTAQRTYLPAWAARAYNTTTNGHTGPNVSGQYPIGHYLEDNAYLGDFGYTQGVDFDLDEYNGRFCVTPEFPNGTYAYFLSIATNGAPSFPYIVNRRYYGTPTGGSVSTISETVATNFLGGTNLSTVLNTPAKQNNTVTLTWSAIEGGKYEVDSSTNLSGWTLIAANVSPNQMLGAYTNTTSANRNFYRVIRTSVATNDNVGTTLFTITSVAPGGSASRGSTVTVTITLPSSPPQPPSNQVPTSVTLAGSISGTLISRPSQGTVSATFTIPANAPTGAQDVVVTFNPAPSYTLSVGFTIN